MKYKAGDIVEFKRTDWAKRHNFKSKKGKYYVAIEYVDAPYGYFIKNDKSGYWWDDNDFIDTSKSIKNTMKHIISEIKQLL